MCPPSDTCRQAYSSDTGPLHTSHPPHCVPIDPISQAAYIHAFQHLHPSILAHSLRVFLHAINISQLDMTNLLPPSAINPPDAMPWHVQPHLSLLFTASLFHDIGTSPYYNTSSFRFEIEGADAAVAFLAQFPSIDGKQKREVWEAIALHSTPQIPERMGGLVRLVRLGVAIDFGRPADQRAKEVMLQEGWVEGMEKQFPRGEIEKVLGDAVVEQALARPEKAPPACWPGGLYRAKLMEPGWEGVNKAF